MRPWRLLGTGTLLLLLIWAGMARAADTLEPAERQIPDLRLSLVDEAGDLTLRLPLAAERPLLYGLLNPYLALGSTAPLVAPGTTAGPRSDPDSVADVRLGAGMAVPISRRVQFYGEYSLVRGRLDAGVGRDLLISDPGAVDIRAGFSIRLD